METRHGRRPAATGQALQVIQRVIKPKILHALCIAPFSAVDIEKIDTVLACIVRTCFNLDPSYPTNVILCPTERNGIGLHSIMVDYAQITAQTLTRALNDTGDLGIITKAMLQLQLSAYGNLPLKLRTMTGRSFYSHALTLRQISILHHAHVHMHISPDDRHGHRCRPDGTLLLDGDDLWHRIRPLLPLDPPLAPAAAACQPLTTTSDLTHRLLLPLWHVGYNCLESLVEGTHGTTGPALITSDALRAHCLGQFSLTRIKKARLALNSLSRFLSGTDLADAMNPIHTDTALGSPRHAQL